MNDQWIIRRTALCFICFFRCLLVQCIRPQSVNCLCWECNKSSFSENLSRFSYCIFVYLVFVYFLNYRFHSFHYTIFLISAQHISGFHCRLPEQASADTPHRSTSPPPPGCLRIHILRSQLVTLYSSAYSM